MPDGISTAKTDLTYTYDSASNRTEIRHPDGRDFDYSYDQSSRMTNVKRAGFDTLAAYTYDQLGRRTKMEQEDGGTSRTVNYFYEPDSALTQLQHRMAGSANDVDYFFSYNLANQVSVRTVNNPTFQFAPVAREETYTANGLNQYTQIVKDQVLTPLTYDANGNLTGDGTWVYTFDVENRLKTASDGSTNVTYTYDPLGRRVKKAVAGQAAVYYLSDGTEEILELNASGNIQNRYVFGPGVDEPILMYDGGGVANGAKHYYRADPQGSIIAMTDDDGNVEDIYTYDSYGMPNDPGGNAIRYTGRRWDAETGLYYYRARMYSPAIGRFLQTDPVGYGDDNNLYIFTRNDPINFFDPTGQKTECNETRCRMTADTFDPERSNGQTTVATPEMREAAEAGSDVVRVINGDQEKLGFGVRDDEGNLKVQSAEDVKNTNRRTGDTAEASPSQGTEFAIHGHIENGTFASDSFVDDPDLNDGFGDTQSLSLKNALPMGTVFEEGVAWHTIEDGQLVFDFPVDSMSDSQIKAKQRNLNKSQKKFRSKKKEKGK